MFLQINVISMNDGSVISKVVFLKIQNSVIVIIELTVFWNIRSYTDNRCDSLNKMAEPNLIFPPFQI